MPVIIIEGGDRIGKNKLASQLASYLKAQHDSVTIHEFPDRKQGIGKAIGETLTRSVISKQQHTAVQLMFAAERWSMIEEIEANISKNHLQILVRFSGSGIVYGQTGGLHKSWCSQIEPPYPIGAYTILLTGSFSRRKVPLQLSGELYEDMAFQQIVDKNYLSWMNQIEPGKALHIDTTGKSSQEVFYEATSFLTSTLQFSTHNGGPSLPIES